jgi:hypothetical protein
MSDTIYESTYFSFLSQHPPPSSHMSYACICKSTCVIILYYSASREDIMDLFFLLGYSSKLFIAQQNQHFPPQNEPLFRSASILRSHKRSNINIVLDSMREITNTIREVSQLHDRP